MNYYIFLPISTWNQWWFALNHLKTGCLASGLCLLPQTTSRPDLMVSGNPSGCLVTLKHSQSLVEPCYSIILWIQEPDYSDNHQNNQFKKFTRLFSHITSLSFLTCHIAKHFKSCLLYQTISKPHPMVTFPHWMFISWKHPQCLFNLVIQLTWGYKNRQSWNPSLYIVYKKIMTQFI